MKKFYPFLFLLLFPFATLFSQQILVSAWSFDELLEADETANVINADIGNTSSVIYLDGTNGSDEFLSTATSPELTVFAGSVLNDPRETPAAGKALTIANNSANSKSLIIKFSMTDLKNAEISFATRGTSTGFSSHNWAWSTDGTNFTDFGENSAVVTTSFVVKTLPLGNLVDNEDVVFLKLTFDGATTASGNNRIDNLVIKAEEDVTEFIDVEMVYGVLPPSSVCGQENVHFVVLAKNNSNINLSDVPFYAKINTPSGDEINLSQSLASFNAGTQMNITFTPSFNAIESGVYSVIAYSALENDELKTNDTTTYSFEVAEILEVPFLADFNDAENDDFVLLEGFTFVGSGEDRMLQSDFTSQNESILETQKRVGPLSFHNHLVFDFRIINSEQNGYELTQDDVIKVYINNDCGDYTILAEINFDNHEATSDFRRKAIPLNAFENANAQVKIVAEKSDEINFTLQIDNLEIRDGDLWDFGVVEKILPINTPCGLENDTLRAVFKNFGDGYVKDIPVAVQVARPYFPPIVTIEDTIRTVLAPNEEIIFTFSETINTATPGKYTLMYRTVHPFDTVASLGHNINNNLIDSIRIENALPLPYFQNFENEDYALQWNTDMIFDSANEYLTKTFVATDNSGYLNSAKRFGPITANHNLFFDYTFVNSAGNALTMSANDVVLVKISDDCGITTTTAYTINSSNHTQSADFQNIQIPLTAFAGELITIDFEMNIETENAVLKIDNIIIDGAPTISIDGPENVNLCQNDTYTAHVSGSSSYDYNWYLNDMLSDVLSTSQDLIITEEGTYIVEATNASGMSSYDTLIVNIVPLPDVQFDLPQEHSSVCPNADFILLTGNTPAGGAFSGDGVSVNRFYPATAGSGTHTITYTATVDGCSASATATITVHQVVDVQLSDLPELCFNDEAISLNQGVPTGGIYSGIGVENNTFDPQTAGVNTHLITYSFTDENACVYTAQNSILVKPLPNAFAGNDTQVCEGKQTTLVASGGTSYLWSTGETNNAIVVSPEETTTYFVTVTGVNGCTSSDDVKVVVNPYPVATLSLPFDTVCMQTTAFELSGGEGTPAGGIGTYSGPGVSGNWFNPAIGMGTYPIKYTYSLSGCDSSATQEITVINCVGIEDFELENLITVQPNPVEDMLFVKIQNTNGLYEIALTDVLGKVLYTHQINENSPEASINIPMENMQKGLYLIHISHNEQKLIKKIMKL